MFDIVSVFHNEPVHNDWTGLIKTITKIETLVPHNLIGIDNRVDNRGFAKACNLGATQGTAPIIGFINPDAIIAGPFMGKVIAQLSEPNIVITGCRFGKSQQELKIWGVADWVCGAAFFVRRDFWEQAGGFDEQFVWGWEETDLIRRAEKARRRVVSIELPIDHASPTHNIQRDAQYKNHWFEQGARLYRQKWKSTR